MYVRRATHSGSWYSDQREVLGSQLQGNAANRILMHYVVSNHRILGWLAEAASEDMGRVRAIIAPHAGYRCVIDNCAGS